MDTQKIEKFSVIGIAVRTSNENGQAMENIPALWDRFMSDGIATKIPNKIDNAIYCIYTDYEKDHTKPYTAIIACKVENVDSVPAGMIGKVFDEGVYTRHIAKGNLLQGIVFDEWMKI